MLFFRQVYYVFRRSYSFISHPFFQIKRCYSPSSSIGNDCSPSYFYFLSFSLFFDAFQSFLAVKKPTFCLLGLPLFFCQKYRFKKIDSIFHKWSPFSIQNNFIARINRNDVQLLILAFFRGCSPSFQTARDPFSPQPSPQGQCYYVKEIVSYVTSCFPLRGKQRRQYVQANWIFRSVATLKSSETPFRAQRDRACQRYSVLC